ncbi:Homeobox protein knotted-1-like 4 [Linum grandiflorum]
MEFHHQSHTEVPLHNFPPTTDQTHVGQVSTSAASQPNWLNSALLLRNPQHPPAGPADTNFLNLASASNSPSHHQQQSQTQWLSGSNSSLLPPPPTDENIIQNVVVPASQDTSGRYKGEILAHPLYEQLLSAHVSCLRIATPVDQLPRIDAQLAQSHNVLSKYPHPAPPPDDKELDHFMSHYFLVLCSFKEQLQQHVRVDAMEAVMACWEIEQSLQSLTGISPGEGSGATMSDEDDDEPVIVESEAATNLYDDSNMGFGPLVPTETERSLMERVRVELKHELKQGYKDKIADIREEILRKRRAGKLPGDTTSVLKSWWQSHSKWPYPTEEDKARLVEETGLQLKQINNWFINQRKRNWHTNPSTSTTSSKPKRKRSQVDLK